MRFNIIMHSRTYNAMKCSFLRMATIQYVLVLRMTVILHIVLHKSQSKSLVALLHSGLGQTSCPGNQVLSGQRNVVCSRCIVAQTNFKGSKPLTEIEKLSNTI